MAHIYCGVQRHTPNIVVFVKTPPMGATAMSKFASKSCSSGLAQTRSPAAIFVPLFIHDGRGHHEDGRLGIPELSQPRGIADWLFRWTEATQRSSTTDGSLF